jgi:hypothetical protein
MRRSAHSLMTATYIFLKTLQVVLCIPESSCIALLRFFFLPGLTYLDGSGLGIDSDCFLVDVYK